MSPGWTPDNKCWDWNFVRVFGNFLKYIAAFWRNEPLPTWPKDKLLKHGPDLPMEERIRRYQQNIRTIRESGCAVPTTAMVDTLDPAEIEIWFADNAFNIDRLKDVMKRVADLPDDTLLPSPFINRDS